MEIEKTPLWKDSRDIILNGDDEAKVGWTAIIHLNNEEKEIYKPIQVKAIDISRDYCYGYADEITCTLEIPLGKYARRIYPNRNHLEITLTKKPLIGYGRDINKEIPENTEKYTATLIDEGRSIVEGQGTETNDEYALDLMSIPPIKFQLYTKAVEQIRMITVGGIFRQTKLDDVIKGILTKETQKIKIDKKLMLKGVDLIPISNKEKKEHVVITHGIKLYDLPNYIQNKYGVYNSGLGSYIQNNFWYIFTLYDTTQFEKREKTLTMLILPITKCPEIEKSYKKKGDALTILISSDTSFKDETDKKYLNNGNGVRLGDSRKFLNNYSTTEDNKTKVVRIENNSEFITDKRDNELNIVNVTGNRITSNPFVVYSDMCCRKGGLYQCIWENSNPSLIFPGMLVKIIYFDKTDIVEIYGVILGTKSTSLRIGEINSKRHTTNTNLYIFVQNKPKEVK